MKKNMIFAIFCLLSYSIPFLYSASLQSEEALKEGYVLQSRGETDKAYEYFLKAYETDNSNITALKELAYADLKNGKTEKAAEKFKAVLKIIPEDMRTRMDLAYALLKTGDKDSALKEFKIVADSSSEFSEIAKKEIESIREEGLKNPPVYPQKSESKKKNYSTYGEFYAYPYYMSRFKDKIWFFESKFYLNKSDLKFGYYLGARYVGDSRSKGGISPEIYNDNFFSYGLGIVFKPLNSVSFNFEAFLANDTINTSKDNRLDVRAVINGYFEYRKIICGPLGLITFRKLKDEKFSTDIGFGLGYYGRYDDNIILQSQSFEKFGILNKKNLSTDIYLKNSLTLDSNSDFYNNIFETGSGVEIRPFGVKNLKLRADRIFGWYLGREGKDKNPYDSYYKDTRISLIYFAVF